MVVFAGQIFSITLYSPPLPPPPTPRRGLVCPDLKVKTWSDPLTLSAIFLKPYIYRRRRHAVRFRDATDSVSEPKFRVPAPLFPLYIGASSSSSSKFPIKNRIFLYWKHKNCSDTIRPNSQWWQKIVFIHPGILHTDNFGSGARDAV